jgi:tetratricopeptide (TPR) repeat protein
MAVEDHYQHLALIGVIVLVAGAWETLRQRARQPLRVTLSLAAAGAVTACAVLTWTHCKLYTDSVMLTQATVAEYPESGLAHHNAGYAMLKARRLEEARAHFERALQFEPDYFDAHRNLGAALAEAGQLDGALEHLREALRLHPDNAYANLDLGVVLRQAGQAREATAYLERALQLQPDSARAHSQLGKTLMDLGRPGEAIAHFQTVLQVNPYDREARQDLARALALKHAADHGGATAPGA